MATPLATSRQDLKMLEERQVAFRHIVVSGGILVSRLVLKVFMWTLQFSNLIFGGMCSYCCVIHEGVRGRVFQVWILTKFREKPSWYWLPGVTSINDTEGSASFLWFITRELSISTSMFRFLQRNLVTYWATIFCGIADLVYIVRIKQWQKLVFICGASWNSWDRQLPRMRKKFG